MGSARIQPFLVADTNSQIRQYLGLAIVIVAYVGGIVGWSWAAMTVEPAEAPPDAAQAVRQQAEQPVQSQATLVQHQAELVQPQDARPSSSSGARHFLVPFLPIDR